MNYNKLITLTALSSFCALGTVNAEEQYYEDYLKTAKEEPATTEQAIAVNIPTMESPVKGNVDIDKLSEAFGNYLGKSLKNSGISFNIEKLVIGIRNGVDDRPSPLSQTEYESMMLAIQQQAFDKLSANNLSAADQFMKNNATQKDVIELIPNKLQYSTLTTGNGPTVTITDTPLINYSGKFIDGSVFSSSEETGGPIAIPLAHTIPGFQKGIVGMKEGEKRRLFIHPDQGYGAAPGHLPPNSLLVFDIEIVKANNPDVDDDNDDDGDGVDDDGDGDDDDNDDKDVTRDKIKK